MMVTAVGALHRADKKNRQSRPAMPFVCNPKKGSLFVGNSQIGTCAPFLALATYNTSAGRVVHYGFAHLQGMARGPWLISSSASALCLSRIIACDNPKNPPHVSTRKSTHIDTREILCSGMLQAKARAISLSVLLPGPFSQQLLRSICVFALNGPYVWKRRFSVQNLPAELKTSRCENKR